MSESSKHCRSDWMDDELLQFCKSEFLSEEGLREICDRHWVSLPSISVFPCISDYKFFFAACCNKLVNEEIIRCLLEYFPEAVAATNDCVSSPLHVACYNKKATLSIIQLLIDAAPDSIASVTNKGLTPLHILCANPDIDEEDAIEISKLLLEKCPESARHTDDHGYLPIHLAAKSRSPEFCRVLIEAYPGSEQISNGKGALPLHLACLRGTLDTVEYLYNLYPDAINHQINDGLYPIHFAFGGVAGRNRPTVAVGIVRFLLDCDPSVKFQKVQGRSLLRFACRQEYNDSNIDAALQIIRAIYDVHPEAIEEDTFARNTQDFHQRVLAFINGELVRTRQARNHRLMTTPDEIGQLPLHHALQNNVRLGSIKLLVQGNPAALRSFDNNGVIPLHVACQHHDSPRVVQHLLDLYPLTLRHEDYDNNTALHYACRGAKYGTIALLLERHDAVSVSKRNAQKKLPIDLLWESDNVEDRESVEYLDIVFRLMKAYPEMLMSIGMQMRQRQRANEMVKKRKFGAV